MSGVLAAAGPSAYWYLARGTGVAALLLLTASVVLGILGSVRFTAPRWPRFAVDSLHRDVSLLVLALLVLHIVTSVLDGFAPITLADAVIPFAGAYRPLWMGLGALAFDLLLALTATSLLRRRLGYRAWRAVHWLAYASWPVAVLHGLGTGSDTRLGWMLAVTALCLGAVVIAVLVRIARAQPGEADRFRAPAVALSIAAPIGIAVFALAGPLQRGWARRAGTPSSLLAAKGAPVANRLTAARSVPIHLKAPFSARLAGKLTQTQLAGGALDDLSLRLSGGARGRLRVRLAGVPLGGGGLSLTGSQVDLLADGLPAVMQGRIVLLQGEQFDAHVAGGSASLNLHASLAIDQSSGNVSGTLRASAGGGG